MRAVSKGAWLAMGVLSMSLAHAATDIDSDALSLADQASATAPIAAPSHWRGSFEAAAANYGAARQAAAGQLNDTARVES